jgi:replicative DNA helicase
MVDIDTYLQRNEMAKQIMERDNGVDFLQDCEAYCEPENFSYYYGRLKKLNLLRELARTGKDISKFYCDDPLEPRQQEINERFERLTTTDIINELKGEVAILEDKYSTNSVVEEGNAYTGIRELFKELQVKPEVGIRLQGDIFNTVCRGGRKGKLYLRSASSGVGKTRSMVGDACNIAYPIRYEPKYGKWISTGAPEKVLYVMTEQDPAEIQTMILAYLSGINEEAILYGNVKEDKIDRILIAMDIMERYQDNMMFAHVPDPCASVIKNLFRKYTIQKGVENFFYDYIFSSPAMLNEYRDLKLREDVALRLFTTALKNLAVELNAFILTSTQVSNDDDKSGGFRDFRNIQGSKAIANLVDLACVMSRPSPEELKLVEGFQSRFHFSPNLVTDVFKNRRGRWTSIRIWSANDLGTCRRHDLFVTTANNEPIEEFQIVDFTFEKTKEMEDLEELYNNGVVIDEETERLLENFAKQTIEIPKLTDTIEEAFGNKQEQKKRLENLDFGDLI